MPTGHGPQFTSPLYASDEQILIRCRGDYAALCPKDQVLAQAKDGYFNANDPWTLNSATIDFQAQGVAAQNVVLFTGPTSQFPGGSNFMAVDSVTGNSVVLRRVGMPLYVGQPPAPIAGATAVSFTMPTLAPQLDNATWEIKDRFGVDEAIFFRSSGWLYQGDEDAYRCFRNAVVYTVLYDAYTYESRTGEGDFEKKIHRTGSLLQQAIERVQARWGPTGNSSEPTTLFSCKLSR